MHSLQGPARVIAEPDAHVPGRGLWARDQSEISESMYLGNTAQARLDDAIRDVASGLSPVVGEAFFHTLVVSLGEAMGVEHVFVAELDCIDHDRASLGRLVQSRATVEFPDPEDRR